MDTPTPAAAAPSAAQTERTYLLERVGEAAVVQVYADGFRDLPPRERLLAWHLAQAAFAGRDIFYDQRYAHNLEMRDVLEAIVTHAGQAGQVGQHGQVATADGADAHLDAMRAIEQYTKL